uniref:Uncharacterized protein n=1 Tax=Leersia perrieri TaxID=77586 RepID=A0A0D9VSQ0_9ORYZ
MAHASQNAGRTWGESATWTEAISRCAAGSEQPRERAALDFVGSRARAPPPTPSPPPLAPRHLPPRVWPSPPLAVIYRLLLFLRVRLSPPPPPTPRRGFLGVERASGHAHSCARRRLVAPIPKLSAVSLSLETGGSRLLVAGRIPARGGRGGVLGAAFMQVADWVQHMLF